MMEALCGRIILERIINDGIPLAEYLQNETDQVDNEYMGNTDASRGIPIVVVVSWSNYLGVKLIILPSTFLFPSMHLINLIRMW